MRGGLAVNISVFGAGAALPAAVNEWLSPEMLRPIAGRAGVNTTRMHLFTKNRTEPNKMGGARTGFYAQAARSANYRDSADGVVVSIPTVGVSQRYNGGVIRAKPGGFLTIPARTEAYGKRAREFNDLRFVVLGDAGPALIRVETTTLKKKKGGGGFTKGASRGGEVMYWLRRSVTQRPDRTVLPPDGAIEGAVNMAIGSYITRRANGGPSNPQSN